VIKKLLVQSYCIECLANAGLILAIHPNLGCLHESTNDFCSDIANLSNSISNQSDYNRNNLILGILLIRKDLGYQPPKKERSEFWGSRWILK
jgi:hypothetical protein